MKDFDLNALMRYVIIGVINLVLIYLLADEVTTTKLFGIIGTADVFGIFSFIALSLGALQYVLYRAIIYPIINSTISGFSSTSDIDVKRIKLSDPDIKSTLDEWASQVHLLYNILLVWIILLFVSRIEYRKYVIAGLLIFLLSSIVHHIRYKNMEKKLLNNNENHSGQTKRTS